MPWPPTSANNFYHIMLLPSLPAYVKLPQPVLSII